MNMQWYRLDLHVHSCLSPCADDTMTPQNIAQMAALEGIHIIAITDHNAAGNSIETAAAADDFGIGCLYGMEVESREGVHLLTYLPTASSMMVFESRVQEHLPSRFHRAEIWGQQLIVDDQGHCHSYPWLLNQSTTLSLQDIAGQVKKLGGLLVPAHADRRSYGLLSVLGSLPDTIDAAAWEVSDPSQAPQDCVWLSNSDAHSLDAMVRPKQKYTYLWAEEPTFSEFSLGCFRRGGRKVMVGIDERVGSTLARFGRKLHSCRSPASQYSSGREPS